MQDLWRLLTLQDPNTRVVLLGTTLLGLASGLIGSFAVLRRRSLVGDAVAHAALPGICVAYSVIGDRHFALFLLGALIFGVLGVSLIAFIRAYTRIKEDAAIGIVLSTLFGLGIALSGIIQRLPGGNRAGLDSFLFGKAASMVRQDVLAIAGVAAFIALAVAALFKEFRLLCFDRDFAQSQGWPVLRLDLGLMALICVCTVVGLPAVGVVLMAALLIIPGVAARFWTDRLGPMVLIAGAIGAGSGLFGTSLSAVEAEIATGPAVALTAAVCCIASLLVAPRRGIIAGLARRWNLERRVGLQHVLRALYEAREAATPDLRGAPVGIDELVAVRSWSRRHVCSLLRRAARRALVILSPDDVSLTERGAAEAAAIVRTHRLWELYLIDQAGIAPDHVDRDADMLEHLLAPAVVRRLQERLALEGRAPEPVPASPHPQGGPAR